MPIRVIRASACMAAIVLVAQSAQAAGYAGLWFQCQPKWNADQNYLLVDVKPGDHAWDAKWGTANSAKGEARLDALGNLLLRGCHAIAGKPAAACNPAKPPTFAVLPKAIAPLPNEAALRRGAWIRTDAAGSQQLARQCGGLRPRPKQ